MHDGEMAYMPSASRSVALSRVCQPLPPAFSLAMISGSSITFTRCFRSASGIGGRPRVAFAKNVSGSSPTSSFVSMNGFFISALLSCVCFAQTDDPHGFAAPTPCHDTKTRIDGAKRHITLFCIFLSQIFNCQRPVPVEQCYAGKIETALAQCLRSFLLIPFKGWFIAHVIYIHILNSMRNGGQRSASSSA